jgi:hypothetical protein
MLGKKGKAGIYQKVRGILCHRDRRQQDQEPKTKPPKGAKARLRTLRQSAKQLGEQQRNEQTLD